MVARELQRDARLHQRVHRRTGGPDRAEHEDLTTHNFSGLTGDLDRLAIDLAHLVFEAEGEPTADQMEGLLSTIQRRINSLGVTEPNVQQLGDNLLNKGIGRYNQNAITMLISYVNAVSQVEEQKDKIRRLFGAAKEPFLAEQAERKSPTIKWAVTIKGGPGGPWGSMTQVKPFEVTKDKKAQWPDAFELGEKKIDRASKGDLGKPEGETIPIDPTSQGAVCPETITLRLMASLSELRSDLKGDDTPGRERDGVTALGEKLVDQLRKIGGPG